MTLAAEFLALHQRGTPLLMPNAWDIGSAKIFEALGFGAIATTSSGFAATLGRLDGAVSADEVFAHCAALVEAVGVPVSADMENGFGHSPQDVYATVRRAIDIGLAGGSIEDFTGDRRDPIYEASLATDRVAAAVDAAGDEFVLTARCENRLHGLDDLDDAIARVRAYAAVGAPVLFVPGLRSVAEIATVASCVKQPINVIVVAGAPTVAEMAAAGAARISVGGAFAFNAYIGAVANALELRDLGTNRYRDVDPDLIAQVRAAFS